MALFFALATPQAVLAIHAGELTAGVAHDALVAQRPGLCLAASTGLRALGLGGKKEMRLALAVGELRPVDVADGAADLLVEVCEGLFDERHMGWSP